MFDWTQLLEFSYFMNMFNTLYLYSSNSSIVLSTFLCLFSLTFFLVSIFEKVHTHCFWKRSWIHIDHLDWWFVSRFFHKLFLFEKSILIICKTISYESVSAIDSFKRYVCVFLSWSFGFSSCIRSFLELLRILYRLRENSF